MAISCIGNIKNQSVHELSWKNLLHADSETLLLPFQLAITDGDPLYCKEILRMIPGKRLVTTALWKDQILIAKLFYGRNAKRHVTREMEGISLLQWANIPTPAVVYQGSAHKQRIHFILFEKIEDSASLESIWRHKEEYLEMPALMRSFTIELATQHVLGILQHDLHLNNFLVTDKHIFTLDGGTIKQVEGPLDKKNSLENVGLFFAQLGTGTQALQHDLFQTYVKARGWLVKKAETELLATIIKTQWQERWRHYEKKIFRTCTAFKKNHYFFKTIIYDRDYQSPDFLNVLQHPDKIFSDSQTVLLKKGRSATVAKLMIDNRLLVIKRYNLKNSIHWLRRCLRNTRAKSAWRIAHRLQLFGILTAKPIAYIEKHFFGLRGTSYFIMEYIPGPHSGDFFPLHTQDPVLCKNVAERIIKLFQSLGELHITHGDPKCTNIIIHRDQPYLIDLDGMIEHTLLHRFQKFYTHEMQRFMRNWNNQPIIFSLFEKLLKGLNDAATKK